jgi:hypothetical protein
MKRDPDIQKVFEVADDSLQGVLGYHLYTIAAQKSADAKKIGTYLPDDRIPITFDWDRFYNKQELVDLFTSPFFELVQARISLIATTNVFDAALNRFVEHLSEKGFRQKPRQSYKQRIEWAYQESLKSDIGNKNTLDRLPGTFGIVDNARRLRNLIVHNHGLFDEKYKTDAIDSHGIQIDLHPGYDESKKPSKKAIPVLITTDYLIRFIRAHIEVLHVLHNGIQKRFFGVAEGYSYELERKPIEWRSILLGNSKVRILFQGHKI